MTEPKSLTSFRPSSLPTFPRKQMSRNPGRNLAAGFSSCPFFSLCAGFLLILFNYPVKLFLHCATAAGARVPKCALCNLIKPHIRGNLIKKLSCHDYPLLLRTRSNISHYEHVVQKLSPQDKLIPPIETLGWQESCDNEGRKKTGSADLSFITRAVFWHDFQRCSEICLVLGQMMWIFFTKEYFSIHMFT